MLLLLSTCTVIIIRNTHKRNVHCIYMCPKKQLSGKWSCGLPCKQTRNCVCVIRAILMLCSNLYRNAPVSHVNLPVNPLHTSSATLALHSWIPNDNMLVTYTIWQALGPTRQQFVPRAELHRPFLQICTAFFSI